MSHQKFDVKGDKLKHIRRYSSLHSSSVTRAFSIKRSSALRLRNLCAMLRSPPFFVKAARTCSIDCCEAVANDWISASTSSSAVSYTHLTLPTSDLV